MYTTQAGDINSMMDMMFCTTMIAAIIIGLIPAIIAKSKGKSFVLWWIYGAGLFIAALPHSLIMKPTEAMQIQQGMKKCPQCAELIKKEAKVCRFCSRSLE